MEAREDLLDVMLGNTTTSQSVKSSQVKSTLKSSPVQSSPTKPVCRCPDTTTQSKIVASTYSATAFGVIRGERRARGTGRKGVGQGP